MSFGRRGARESGQTPPTTGNPILNPYTRGDIVQWSEVMARCYRAAGVTAGDVIQITPSFGLFTGGLGFHYVAEAISTTVISVVCTF